MLSFLITFAFLGILFYKKVSIEVDKVRIANDIEEDVAEPVSVIEKLSDELDVSNYVGIYSRTINLQEEVKLNTCTMTSYKLLYKIEKNKKITKYFQSDCLGTIEMYSSTLSYYNNGGARYIGTERNNFIFGTNSMKEVDGETYKIEEGTNKISERLIDKNIETYFPDNTIIIVTNDNIISIKESLISFRIPEDYNSTGGGLTKRFYGNNNYTFRFIVFNNTENVSCYDNEESEDLLYTIYQVTYNKEDKEFGSIKQIVTRTKNAGCTIYKEDLETLKG